MKSFQHKRGDRFAPYRRPEERGNRESDSDSDTDTDSDNEQDEEEIKKWWSDGYIYKCRGECGQVHMFLYLFGDECSKL